MADITRSDAVSASVTNPYAMGPLLRLLLYRKDTATQAVIDMLLEPTGRPGTTAAIADWLPSLMVPPSGAMSTRPEGWEGLAVPLAFLWGDRDSVTPLEQGQRLADLTGAPLSILPEVGHIPQIEAAPAFQAALIAILADLAP